MPTPTLTEKLTAALPATIDDTDPHITDRFGVTYRGPRPFLTLYALIRADLTELGDFRSTIASSVRVNAKCLAHWFTHPGRDSRASVTFGTYTPAQVCNLVTYLTFHTDAAPPVGPRTVALYTSHLTDGSIRPRPAPPLPQPVDEAPLYLANPAAGLPITVTTPADTVPITVEFDAEEHLTWTGKSVTVAIPAAEIAAALLTPRTTFTTLLEENRSLTDPELRNDTAACTVPRGLRGLDITVTRLTPATAANTASGTTGPHPGDTALIVCDTCFDVTHDDPGLRCGRADTPADAPCDGTYRIWAWIIHTDDTGRYCDTSGNLVTTTEPDFLCQRCTAGCAASRPVPIPAGAPPRT